MDARETHLNILITGSYLTDGDMHHEGKCDWKISQDWKILIHNPTLLIPQRQEKRTHDKNRTWKMRNEAGGVRDKLRKASNIIIIIITIIS